MAKTGRREPSRPAAPPQSPTATPPVGERKSYMEAVIPVVAAGLVAGIGWLIAVVYAMNGTLNGFESKLSATDTRVERIATALPTVAHQIAIQEITEPASAVIIATKPVPSAGGGWESALHVMDPVQSRTTTYVLHSDDEVAPHLTNLIRGSVVARERWAASLSEMRGFLVELDDTATFPMYVDLEGSYVLRSTSADAYLRELEAMTTFDTLSRRVTPLRGDLHSWRAISGELIANPSKYQIESFRDSGKIFPR